MQPSDLHSIWEENNKQADAYYASIEPEILAKAQRRSKATVASFKRFIRKETIIGLFFILPIALYNFRGPAFWYVTLLVVLSLIPILLINYFTFRKLDSIMSEDVIWVIRQYAKALKQFEQRIVTFLYLVNPLFASALVLLARMDNDPIPEWNKTYWIAGVAFLFGLAVAIFTQNVYYKKFVGDKWRKLESIADHLEEEK